MSLYKSSQTDPNKEKDGVPLEYGLNSKKEPITFIVAREGGRNVQYQKVAEHIFKPFRRQIQHGQIDPEVLENLLAQVYSKAVVKGWSGVEDEHDELLPFNEANVTLCPAQIAGGVLTVKLIVGSWILNGTTAEQPTLSVIVTV